MKISDIMTLRVETVRPEDTLQEVAYTMKEFEVGLLPVYSEDRITGVVTDRDMVVRGIAQGLDPISTPVRDVMTAAVVCCFEEDDAEEAARLMQERHVSRLIVFDRNLRLAGVVSLADLATVTDDPQRVAEVLQDLSEAAMPRP